MPRPLRRRDFLSLSALVVGAGAVAKAGGRWVVGVAAPDRPLSGLAHLSDRQAATVTAAALAMVGPRGESAYDAGRWEPARDVDDLLGNLAADQRGRITLGLLLFEEWTPGLHGFSSWDMPARRARLAAWRTSRLALQRGVWGFLHGACCSSFSRSEAGWEAMDYPGPCVGTGRSPGQSAAFAWDPVVP